MPPTLPAPLPPRSRLLPAILLGGLIAGTWDLGFAFVYYGAHGATPLGVMQSVAGGLLGRVAAREGGLPTATLGVILHYSIALTIATAYVAASRRWPALLRHAIACGLLYGAAVYFFMNMVVLPLSALHAKVFSAALLAPWPLAAHLIGVGLPVALVARRFAVPAHSD